jgi:nucleotide-binding universal stress UspA family protein
MPGKEAAVAQDQQGTERQMVVGVDGSGPSKAALAWSVRQAALTGAVVDALIAWEHPAGTGLVAPPDAHDRAAQVLADAIAEAGSPGCVRPRVVKGHPARVLIDASASAELLVVGDRRHAGEFAGAPLGAVSQRCVQHAHCPVVVIRGTGVPAVPGWAQATEAAGQPAHPR